MKRLQAIFILLLIVSIALSGCQGGKEKNKITIFFFTNFPTTLTEEFEVVIASHLDELNEEDVQVEIYPMSMEKIFIELTAKMGNIYFIDKESVQWLIDPIGLEPLDEIVTELSLEDLVPDEYKDINPETNQLSSYAVPITRHSSIMDEIGIRLLESDELGAFVPSYIENKELTLKLLQHLSTQ